eukprot:3758687-Rhodomonas_salina.1
MVTFRSSFKFCLKQLTTNPQFRQREGDKTSRGSIHTATSTSGTKPHGMSHNPERKICVQYNPGPDDEAGSSNEKIREATLSKEYDLQDVPTMQALLQKVAKDFPMVQDRVNLVYDDGKYVGPEIIETDAEMTDVTIEGSGPVAAYKRPQEKVLGKIKSICQFRSYQNVLEEQIGNPPTPCSMGVVIEEV